MSIQLTRDQTFQVVLNVRTPTKNGINTGTGLFVRKETGELYILTASHVALDCNNHTEIIISDANGNCQSFSITLFNASISWKHHPIADVSVLPISPAPSLLSHLTGRFLPYAQLNTTEIPPSRDAFLTSVGFPCGLGATGKFSPFTFRSHASSSLITLERFDTKMPTDFFTLENPSVGGYSGGPVFDLGYIIVGAMLSTTGPTICHGIMHGTISDSTGGKIAAVTPCSLVKDII